MVRFVVKLVAIVFVLVIILGFLRTWQMEHSKSQTIFEGGKVPSPLPDGLYKGSVPGHTFSWQGKKFDSANNKGINIFDENGTTTENYPFKTSVTKGLRDKNLEVVKIDYNIIGNPFWLRIIVDEIVEIAPGDYLGKLHVRIIGFTFTLGYFQLKK